MTKFSIVIPSYKTSFEVMDRAIQSILKQTYRPFEIIIVDDNESSKYADNSKQIASEYKETVKVLFNGKNCGANYSRNKGILASCGQYIAFLDSDDSWDINYLKSVCNLIEKRGAKFITTNYQVVHRDGILPPEFNEKDFISGNIWRKEIYKDYVGPTSTVVVEKATLIKAGLFDVNLPARQDYDMWLRVCKYVDLYYNYTPSVLVYRDGHTSISSSYIRNVEGTKMVLAKIVADPSLTDDEIQLVNAGHYKHMALACILCNAYFQGRIYAFKSLTYSFAMGTLGLFVMCFFPWLFTQARIIRRKILYMKSKSSV